MRITLAAVNRSLLAAWRRWCGDLPGVEIRDGSILDLRVDAVVSPANSFGFMDGGLDLLYSRRFGPAVEDGLRRHIATRHRGELLVGQAEIVETGDLRIPRLICAPTMRVPGRLPAGSVNAYLAARAALRLALGEALGSVAIPGLGTGVGGMEADACARQVALAIEEMIWGEDPHFPTWQDARDRHLWMAGGGDWPPEKGRA